MPLDLLNINNNYFTNLKDLREPPRSIYFDNQFSVFDTYINNRLIPYVNTLIDGRVPGTDNVASIGKFLRYFPQYDNDGNLITNLKWDVVVSNDFDDYTIAYSKISNAPAGSIMSAGTDQNFVPILPVGDDQVLVSRTNEASIWRKLRDEDVPDRSITGNMIALASIPGEAFQEGIIKTELTVDSITNVKFPDRAVTGPKIADGAIDDIAMGAALANNFLNTINSNFIPLNSINLGLVPNNKLEGLRFFQLDKYSRGDDKVLNARIFSNLPWETRVFKPLRDASLIGPKSITSDKIDDGIIPANTLQFYIAHDAALPGIATLIDVGAIEPEHLDNELKAYLRLI